jgi:hypothetical protein
VPTPLSVLIGGNAHESLLLSDGQQLILTVARYPLFLVLPSIADLAATVYNSSGYQSGSFSTPTKVFAVYFSEGIGKIVFTAAAPTILKYFAVVSTFPCASYFVSSSPNEQWGASQTKGNFTLGHSQNICLFHVSDNVTNVAGVYDTEFEFDYLYYQYSGSNSTVEFYTGSGSFSSSSRYFTVFYWSSDEYTPSTSFDVRLSSPLSSLPYRRGHGSGRSAFPILMEYQEDARTRTSRRVLPTRASTRVPRSQDRTLLPTPTQSSLSAPTPSQSSLSASPPSQSPVAASVPSGSPPPPQRPSRSRSRSRSRAPPPTEEDDGISPTESGRPPKEKLKFGDIAGIVGAGLVAAIGIGIGVVVLVRCYTPKRADRTKQGRRPIELYTEEHQY